MKHSFLTIILFLTFLFTSAQTIEKEFSGSWGRTSWHFEFHKDGTFKRTSRGHYGNTIVEGTYKIYNDTIEILRGFDNTAGTINQYYLLDGENCIIDTRLKYDYKTVDTIRNFTIIYDKGDYRNFKYPQVPYKDIKWKNDLDNVLNIAFNLPEVVELFRFDKHKGKKPLLANYFELNTTTNPNFTVAGQTPIFFSLNEGKSSFYIEIIDINQNPDEIEIEFKIRGEKKTVHIYFRLNDNKWTLHNLNKYDF